MNKTKWIYYTVGVGILPIVLRLLAAIFSEEKKDFLFFAPADIIFFGLVLCVSNINEVELLKKNETHHKWITRTNGMSIIYMILYTFLFGLVIANEIHSNTFNIEAIKWASGILSFTFFIFTLSVYKNLKLYNE